MCVYQCVCLAVLLRCSLKSECRNSDQALQWLDYVGKQCTKILSIVPSQVPIQRGLTPRVRFHLNRVPSQVPIQRGPSQVPIQR